ncbi:MAG: DUF2214 family protein [Serpentinimonas sp.]|jgi:putative membrane protein|nr:DUF2214 family protein [Serpentinimonas sp.]
MSQLLSLAHLLFAAIVLACPVLGLALLGQPFNRLTATLLRRVEWVNGMAAVLVLVIGLVRLFHFGKGVDHYLHNLPFLGKLVLYGVASGLSLVSTLEIRRWGAPLKAGRLPEVAQHRLSAMRSALAWQLACGVGMAVLAVLAANGVGSLV